jgi:hypothetical protein
MRGLAATLSGVVALAIGLTAGSTADGGSGLDRHVPVQALDLDGLLISGTDA